MKKNDFIKVLFMLILFTVAVSVSAQATPVWLNNLDKEYPSSDWVAAVGYGNNRIAAEQAALNNLARVLRTNTANITQTAERFDKIARDAEKKKTVSFNLGKNFLQQSSATENIKGLIGVQIEHFVVRNSTHYICLRINRAEYAPRYSAIVQENTAVINKLMDTASKLPAGFDKYAILNYASLVAEITDHFQNILEVIDSTARNRKPSYGTANSVKTKTREAASGINIGISTQTGDAGADSAEIALVRRAISSFFTGKGFKVNNDIQSPFVLYVTIRLEQIPIENNQSCRYLFDTFLEKDKKKIFTFKEEDHAIHSNSDEARRIAVRQLEFSAQRGKFANDFDAWLDKLVE